MVKLRLPVFNEGSEAQDELQVRHLTFSYQDVLIFDDFSLSSSDRLIILRGPSGCGKTTLLKILSRNLSPSLGAEIRVPRQSLMLVQEDALAPWLTGLENITRFADISLADLENHPAFMHIRPFLSRRACRMSYGQRRLIELTRATLLKPSLLCLDEPFNFLDPSSRLIFVSTLMDKALLSKTRIVITSHYLEDFGGHGICQFEFDGKLPVRELRKTGEARN